MGNRLTTVAFDIETTGFETNSIVTVFGFALPLGCRIFLNTSGAILSETKLQSKLAEVSEENINISTHRTERELLLSVKQFTQNTLQHREYLLVAYNGERYQQGFDLPFLRTRYALQDMAWPFVYLPYADLLPIFQHRFNTVSKTNDDSTLSHVYESLIGGNLSTIDPFTSSKCAVKMYENGKFTKIILHNIADILRTQALANLAERYCSKSDFRVKSLSPAVSD